MRTTIAISLLTGLLVSVSDVSAHEVRPLNWSKLESGADNDELAAMCATVMEHTQDGIGRDWIEKVERTRRVGDLLDFGYVPQNTKRKRRAMEDAIRPMTTTARTLALAIRTGLYRADKAGAEVAEIEKLFPLVIRSLAKDHEANGGIGKDTWGNSWQSAMWAGQLAQAAWIVWDKLEPADRELVLKVLVHEADRFLNVAPPVSNKKSVEDTKGEENVWNMGCLLTAATMLRNHPHEAAWREQAIVYFLNAVATPYDVDSATVVDGKPLSERLVGYCITKDYAVGNHKAYPHPGYTASSYLGSRQIFFCTLAGVEPPEALLYNAAPIYRMFVDHEWKAPPCVAPGGTIYQADGGIYWPVEKEKERAGRYYKWFKQDVMADTFGFDKECSTKAAYWAKLHGQCMVDAITGKPTPAKLEAYHKGAFFKNALTCYLIRVLHVNNQLAPVRALSTKAADTKPNVLFIAVDDLRPELGCYGNEWIGSPNIDKLAARGMRFNRAHCQVPTCGASRASLLTGLRPASGRFRSYDCLAEKDAPGATTLPEEFKNNGYHCISNGKVFHHPEDTADRSWSETPWRPEMSGLDTLDPKSKNMIGGRKQRGPVFESPDVPDNAYRDGQVADKTIEDLKRMKEAGTPFFLACGFWKPHLPFYAPKKYWDLYDREQIELADNQYMPKNAPESLRGSGEIRSYHDRGLEYNSEEWHRSLRHGYYACVSYIDAQVGRVLQALDELGLREDTIVILWGDHGWHLGEHTFWGKHNLMTLALNSPLIVTGPGVKEGQRTDRLVEFVDIYPSLCDMAGIPTANEGIQGTSFKPLLTTPDLPWKSAAFSLFRGAQGCITERYNYVEYKDGGRMLYDLEKDPQENVNVAGNPENKKLVRQLAQQLEEGWEVARP